jgi:hypothetical protein
MEEVEREFSASIAEIQTELEKIQVLRAKNCIDALSFSPCSVVVVSLSDPLVLQP